MKVKLFRRGEDREKEGRETCKHDFETIEGAKKCEICDIVVETVKEYFCRKCGQHKTEIAKLMEYQTIEVRRYADLHEYVFLCEKCYKEYKRLVDEVMAYLEERSVGIDMNVDCSAVLVNGPLPIDWKNALEKMLLHFEFISKPVLTPVDGIQFFAFPKDLLGQPYAIFITPQSLINHLKIRRGRGEKNEG